MADNGFRLTTELDVVFSSRSLTTINELKKEISSSSLSIDVNVPKSAATNLKGVAAGANSLDKALKSLNPRFDEFEKNLNKISVVKELSQQAAGIAKISAELNKANQKFDSATKLNDNLKKTKRELDLAEKKLARFDNRLKKVSRTSQRAGSHIEDFGKQSGIALKRFGSFALVTNGIIRLQTAIFSAVGDAIEFQNEMIRLAQVTKATDKVLTDLERTISETAKGLGLSSKELSNVAVTLAQTGLEAEKVKVALEAVALADLSPTFNNMTNTGEATIALMRQFGLGVDDLKGKLGAINAVASNFAVEADDIAIAIRKSGGAFAAAGGNIEELIGLFTSVRATSRESADSIAAGLRTIVTRLQRVGTQDFLANFGINLRDSKNQFVGPLEAIRRISEALKNVPSTDPLFAQIAEKVAGARQISKVVPLLKQTQLALDAVAVAQGGATSLTNDQIIAQESLARQLTQTKEAFLELVRNFLADEGIKNTISNVLELTRAFIGLVDSLKGLTTVLPLLAGVGIASKIPPFSRGFGRGIRTNKFQDGGLLPGTSNRDNIVGIDRKTGVPVAEVQSGEFVVRKPVVEKLGVGTLAAINRTGNLPKAQRGGLLGASGVGGFIRQNPAVAGIGAVGALSFLSDLEGETTQFVSALTAAGVGLLGLKAVGIDITKVLEKKNKAERAGLEAVTTGTQISGNIQEQSSTRSKIAQATKDFRSSRELANQQDKQAARISSNLERDKRFQQSAAKRHQVANEVVKSDRKRVESLRARQREVDKAIKVKDLTTQSKEATRTVRSIDAQETALVKEREQARISGVSIRDRQKVLAQRAAGSQASIAAIEGKEFRFDEPGLTSKELKKVQRERAKLGTIEREQVKLAEEEKKVRKDYNRTNKAISRFRNGALAKEREIAKTTIAENTQKKISLKETLKQADIDATEQQLRTEQAQLEKGIDKRKSSTERAVVDRRIARESFDRSSARISSNESLLQSTTQQAALNRQAQRSSRDRVLAERENRRRQRRQQQALETRRRRQQRVAAGRRQQFRAGAGAGVGIIASVGGGFLSDAGFSSIREGGGTLGNQALAIGGGIAAGAGTGAALGAVAGPIGAAVGAVAGGLFGLVTSLNSTQDEIRDFNFSRDFGDVGTKIAQLVSGEGTIDTLGGSINEAARAGITRLSGTSGVERATIAGNIQQRLPDFARFTTEVAKGVDTFAQFQERTQDVTALLALLRDVPVYEVEKEMKKLFEATKEQAAATKEVQAEFEKLQRVIQTGIAVRTAIDGALANFESRLNAVSVFEAGITGGALPSGGFDIRQAFDLARQGTITPQFEQIVSNVSGTFGAAGADFEKEVNDSAKAIAALPDILLNLRQERGISEEGQFEDRLAQELKKAGIGQSIQDKILGQASRGKESNADNLLNNFESFTKSFQNSLQGVVEEARNLALQFEETGKQVQSLLDKRNASEKRVDSFRAKQRSIRFKAQQTLRDPLDITNRLSLADAEDVDTANLDAVLGDNPLLAGLKGSNRANSPIATVDAFDNTRQALQKKLQQTEKDLEAATGTAQFGQLLEKRNQEKDAIDRLNRGLNQLADTSFKLKTAQDKLAEVRAGRQQARDFGTNFLFSNRRSRRNQSRLFRTAQRAASQGDLAGIRDSQKSAVLSLFKSLGDSKVFQDAQGDFISGKQAIDLITKGELAKGTLPPDIQKVLGDSFTPGDEEKKLQQTIADLSGQQVAALQKQIDNELRFQAELTALIRALPQDIANAASQAALQTQANDTQRKADQKAQEEKVQQDREATIKEIERTGISERQARLFSAPENRATIQERAVQSKQLEGLRKLEGPGFFGRDFDSEVGRTIDAQLDRIQDEDSKKIGRRALRKEVFSTQDEKNQAIDAVEQLLKDSGVDLTGLPSALSAAGVDRGAPGVIRSSVLNRTVQDFIDSQTEQVEQRLKTSDERLDKKGISAEDQAKFLANQALFTGERDFTDPETGKVTRRVDPSLAVRSFADIDPSQVDVAGATKARTEAEAEAKKAKDELAKFNRNIKPTPTAQPIVPTTPAEIKVPVTEPIEIFRPEDVVAPKTKKEIEAEKTRRKRVARTLPRSPREDELERQAKQLVAFLGLSGEVGGREGAIPFLETRQGRFDARDIADDIDSLKSLEGTPLEQSPEADLLRRKISSGKEFLKAQGFTDRDIERTFDKRLFEVQSPDTEKEGRQRIKDLFQERRDIRNRNIDNALGIQSGFGTGGQSFFSIQDTVPSPTRTPSAGQNFFTGGPGTAFILDDPNLQDVMRTGGLSDIGPGSQAGAVTPRTPLSQMSIQDMQRQFGTGQLRLEPASQSGGAAVSRLSLEEAARQFGTGQLTVEPSTTTATQDQASPIETFQKSTALFNDSINKFEQAVGAMPTEISLEGNHKVEVVINGAQAFETMMPSIQNLVVNEINTSINQFMKDNLKMQGTFNRKDTA